MRAARAHGAPFVEGATRMGTMTDRFDSGVAVSRRSPMVAGNELASELPEDWVARTTTVFRPSGAERPDAPCLIITHEPIPWNEALVEASTRRIRALSSLPHVRTLGPNAIELDGVPALQVAYEWVAERELLGQVHVFFVTGADERHLTHVTFGYVASDYARLEPVFARALAAVMRSSEARRVRRGSHPGERIP